MAYEQANEVRGNTKKIIMDTLDIAGMYLGVVFVGCLVSFMKAKTQVERAKVKEFDDNEFERGFVKGFSSGYAQRDSELSPKG